MSESTNATIDTMQGVESVIRPTCSFKQFLPMRQGSEIIQANRQPHGMIFSLAEIHKEPES